MKQWKQKLRSRTGASITVALLLFLVCAVLSSVVLAAATSAAGRMSNMAETDQRYYAVTSAAGLLRDTLEKESGVIEETTVTPYLTTCYTDGTDPTTAQDSSRSVTVRPTVINGEPVDSITMDDLATFLTYVYVNNHMASATSPVEKQLTLRSALTEGTPPVLQNDTLAVSVLAKLYPNGDLDLTLYNTNTAKGTTSAVGSTRYAVELKFTGDISTTEGIRNEILSSTPLSGSSYTVSFDEIKTVTTTILWHLTDMNAQGGGAA